MKIGGKRFQWISAVIMLDGMCAKMDDSTSECDGCKLFKNIDDCDGECATILELAKAKITKAIHCE